MKDPCHLALTLLSSESVCPACGHPARNHPNYPANRPGDPNYNPIIHGGKREKTRDAAEQDHLSDGEADQ